MVRVRAWTFGEFVLDHLCRASGSREEILRIKEEVCTTMGNHLIVIMWELDLMQELTHQETSKCLSKRFSFSYHVQHFVLGVHFLLLSISFVHLPFLGFYISCSKYDPER